MKLYKSNFHTKTFLQTLVMVRNVPGIDAKPYHGNLILKEFQTFCMSMQNQASLAIKEALEYCHSKNREQKMCKSIIS